MSPPLELDYIGLSPGMSAAEELKSTELRLGLPGSESPDRKALTLELLPAKAGGKRGFADAISDGAKGEGKGAEEKGRRDDGTAAVAEKAASPTTPQPAAKAQVVGWPPIRNYRKNTMASNQQKNKDVVEESKQGTGCLYIKVSMDGAPYLRKIDLKTYCNYKELSLGLEKMFIGFTSGKEAPAESRKSDILGGSEYVLTYEDKDGDWMLVGDVPWEMFADSCRRLRIMKGSDAIGLAPRAMEKSKNRN